MLELCFCFTRIRQHDGRQQIRSLLASYAPCTLDSVGPDPYSAYCKTALFSVNKALLSWVVERMKRVVDVSTSNLPCTSEPLTR